MSRLRRELNKDKLERVFESNVDAATGNVRQHIAFRPSLIDTRVDGETFEKKPDADDRERVRRIAQLSLPTEVPTNRLPCRRHVSRLAISAERRHARPSLLSAPGRARLAAMWRRANAHADIRLRHMLLYFVEQAIWGNVDPQSLRSYALFASQPSTHRRLLRLIADFRGLSEYNLGNKLSRLVKTFGHAPARQPSGCVMTASTTAPLDIPDNSVDYVFTDPPFGENIYYADLNFLVESWHGVLTNAAPEAIVDRFKKKGLPEYQRLMQRCFEEYQRVLKPGRWITVVFHNSRNAVWTAIQEAMLAASFVVADVRTMDKQQGSYRQVTSTAVKQDLVISAYKPNDGLEERFTLTRGTEEGVWDFLRTHLGQLPVFVAKDGRVEVVNERQPHLLFDRMVAFHVLRNVTVPLSIGEFLAGLVHRFPERDGMVFLLEQVAEYDKKRLAAEDVVQLEIFVVDESSAIQWLKRQLARKPQSFQDIHPQFLREIAGWQKHEKLPELSEMLDQNFLFYGGAGEVPSQIHAYLSTNFKELRGLPKDHPALRAKATSRWYVPDPNKAADVEMRRTRILLREFEDYRRSPQRRLKLFRLEAVRAGFFKAYQDRDYETIIKVAEKIPEAVLQEDQKLLLWYDQALTRTEAA